MVSGFVTSPCDQLRIFSGEAKLMRMASKSAIGFARSNGLERNMFLHFLRQFAAAGGSQCIFGRRPSVDHRNPWAPALRSSTEVRLSQEKLQIPFVRPGRERP